MTVDFTKFAFPALESPHAASLTEALKAPPVSGGFVVVTIKHSNPVELESAVREFVFGLRESAAGTGMTDVTVYRQLRRQEFGGAIPFDQAICDRVLDDVGQRRTSQPDRFPAAAMAPHILMQNEIADWVIFVELDGPDQAKAAAEVWRQGDRGFEALRQRVEACSINAFHNMMRYASVSRDPNAIQFFNLFPAPGDLDTLWQAWQDALPWFFEIGEIRSSFPLLALDPNQPLLLVNYAHCDSVKHFLAGVAYDPIFMEVMQRCYAARHITSPHPFFCKIVAV